MERYATVVDDGVLYIDLGEQHLPVGEMDAIVDIVGGETYEIEYDSDHSQVVEWLDLDEEGTMSFEVRETIADMDFPEEFVRKLAERDDEGDPSERVEFFAETMTTIWEAKGNLDDDENPFTR